MTFTRRQRVMIIVVIALAVTSQVRAERAGHYTLNPKTYKSPSGEFELYVDPSTIYGQGAGSYRMTRGGVEVWSKQLPFTLWDAEVAKDGLVAGYAYSLGMENDQLDWNKPEEGKLHLVLLTPAGELRLNEIMPRRGTLSDDSTVDLNVDGILLDPDNDRFVVRLDEGDWSARREYWRSYRISTGELLHEFKFGHPPESNHEYWHLLSTKAVAGTPLILVNWKYIKWEDTGNQVRAVGGRFNLIDPTGQSHWELDRPDDYPDYYEYGKRLDMQEDYEECNRLNKLEDEINKRGAILRTDSPGHFDLWFVKESQRVTFEITKTPDGAWQVSERSRIGYSFDFSKDSKETRDKPETLTLRHLGTIELQVESAPPPEIRDVAYFDLDDRGRIGFLRADGYTSRTFLLIDTSGAVLWQLDLDSLFGDRYLDATVTWLAGARWLLIAQEYREVPGSDDIKAIAKAFWLDVQKQTAAPIEPFTAPEARHVAALPDGGFVVLTEPEWGTNQRETVVAFDCAGKQRWCFVSAPEGGSVSGSQGITVTSDGYVVVQRNYRRDLTILDRDGQFLRTLNCEDTFGSDADAEWFTPDIGGGLLIRSGYKTGRFWRVRLDGTVRDGAVRRQMVAKHRDGRLVELPGNLCEFGVRVDKNGTLWACDEDSFLRLNEEGIVEQVLGEAPDCAILRDINGVTIDQQGRIYLAQKRNGITHVFDADGRRIRLLRPAPTDFERSWCTRIEVASDGRVFIDGLEFSPTGARVGFRKLPPALGNSDRYDDRVCYQPHSRRYWYVSSQEVSLVDERNEVVRTIKRRPDGNWLDDIGSPVVAPDGSLALTTSSRQPGASWDEESVTICFYAPSGEPLKSMARPNYGAHVDQLEQYAYNGRYLLAYLFVCEGSPLLLADTAAQPPKWYDLGSIVPYEDQWHYFFVKDGRELWMLAEEARKIERFALPDQPTTAPASQPAAPT